MNVCMLAYAHYINDARIKSYVRTLEAEGHGVDVIALRAEGEAVSEARPTGTIFRVMDKYQGESTLMYMWSYLAFFLKAAFLLARLSFRRKYDVVHVHNMPNVLVFAAMGPKLLGARVMLDVHDLMTANYMAKFHCGENSPAVKILKIEQRLAALFADHVFCADHNQQDYLAAYCGVRREKVTVLMNLPNVDLFKPVAAERPAGVFRMIYHGTIAYRLGIDLIIRAVAKASERIPVQLWLYGAGDYLPEALALASELGMEQKIHFNRKFFPVEQIPEMVCGMDLGVIGNRRNLACDKYMLPVKLLEYVYLGVPVIAPRLEVIMRYFDDTMVRYYEPENVEQMADAIVALCQDQEERERKARAAVGFYRKHNNKAQAELYLDLLTPPMTGLRARASHQRL
jgi:glycosyltransferase involved in cell wall biosynthesis